MKRLVTLASMLAFYPLSHGEEVDWKDIGREVEIIGQLGVPLGNVVKIEATVIDGADLSLTDFRLRTMRFLRVDAIEGETCAEPPVMHFSVYPDPESYSTPTDPEAARQQDERLKLKSPRFAPIGTKFTLWAFESGSTPPNTRGGPFEALFGFVSMLPDPAVRSHPGPYFRTVLHVVAPEEEHQLHR